VFKSVVNVMKYRPQSHEIQGSPVLGDHNTDYFKNWTSQQLYDIDNITRPIEPVTPEIYSERIKKNEVSRNKKMTHCINMATSENAPNWAKDFLQELSSGAEKVSILNENVTALHFFIFKLLLDLDLLYLAITILVY
jgi:hypothetical protein